MRPRTIGLLVAVAILGAAAAIALFVPQTRRGTQAIERQPDEIELIGLVRDFPMSHPDFGVGSGHEHVAGAVRNWLAGDRRPGFVPLIASWYGARCASTARTLTPLRSNVAGMATPSIRRMRCWSLAWYLAGSPKPQLISLPSGLTKTSFG